MELTISATLLAKELGLMQGVVEKRTTHQILTNVLLEAKDGRLSLTATDLDTTFLSEVEASVKTPGAVTAPARRLYEVLRDLPGDASVRLRVLENHHVEVDCKSPKLRIRLNGLPATDYPTRPEAAGGPVLTLTFGALRRMVEKVRFAVSTEEMRLQLQGALLKVKKDKDVEMVATDGHRLALVEVDGAQAENGFEPVLVSKKILDELGKLDASDDTPVTVVRGTNHIGFTVGSRRLFSKLDERRFPDYEKVISKENNKKAVVSREELLGAVRRIALLSGDRMKAVSLAFKPGAVVVSAESQDVGDGDQEMAATYGDTPVTLRLNARYLEQFLEAVDSDEVNLAVKDEQAQCQGRPTQPLAGIKSYLYVVMPMRI